MIDPSNDVGWVIPGFMANLSWCVVTFGCCFRMYAFTVLNLFHLDHLVVSSVSCHNNSELVCIEAYDL